MVASGLTHPVELGQLDVQRHEVVHHLTADGCCSSDEQSTLVQTQQSLDFSVIDLLEDFEHGCLFVLCVTLESNFLGLAGYRLLEPLDISRLLQHFLHHLNTDNVNLKIFTASNLLPDPGYSEESRWSAPLQVVNKTTLHHVLVSEVGAALQDDRGVDVEHLASHVAQWQVTENSEVPAENYLLKLYHLGSPPTPSRGCSS